MSVGGWLNGCRSRRVARLEGDYDMQWDEPACCLPSISCASL